MMDQDHLPALLLLRMVNQYHLEAHLQKLHQVVDLEHLQAQIQELIQVVGLEHLQELLQVENQNHLHHQKRIVQKVAEDVDKIRDMSLEVHQKVGKLLLKTRV